MVVRICCHGDRDSLGWMWVTKGPDVDSNHANHVGVYQCLCRGSCILAISESVVFGVYVCVCVYECKYTCVGGTCESVCMKMCECV